MLREIYMQKLPHVHYRGVTVSMKIFSLSLLLPECVFFSLTRVRIHIIQESYEREEERRDIFSRCPPFASSRTIHLLYPSEGFFPLSLFLMARKVFFYLALQCEYIGVDFVFFLIFSFFDSVICSVIFSTISFDVLFLICVNFSTFS